MSATRHEVRLLIALAAASVLLAVLAAGLGAYRVDWYALFDPSSTSGPALNVLMQLRLPRVVLAGCVGAALALAGTTLQALFRNPLADPGLLGIGSGAAVGAGLMICVMPVDSTFSSPWAVPTAAFIGALLVARLALTIGARDGAIDVTLLLLVGIAINALGGAALGLLLFVADDAALRDFTFWTLGSLSGASWRVAGPVLLATLVAGVVMLRANGPLNAFVLGERNAFYLGIDIAREKRRLVLATSLAVGACVAVTGLIGFIGLVVPHLARFLVGPNHRVLLPAAASLGASLLITADLIARTAVLPAEMPVGIVTACLGAPAFLWLIRRHFRQSLAR